MISDDVIGIGTVSLPTSAGEKNIPLKSKDGEDAGSIFVSLTCEKVPARSITLTNIKCKFDEKGDILGSSEPYVVATVGGWSGRT